MKEKILDFTFCLFCFITLVFIFKHNTEVASIILKAVNLFFKRVFVSLFPMFMLNDILISLNIPYYAYKLFNKLFRWLFHTNGIAAYVFFMSLISGSPSNAYILKELYEDKKIDVLEANHFLTFTYFSNPLFLITMLRIILPLTTTLKIMLIHYSANIIIGIIRRRKAPPLTNAILKRSNKQIDIPKSLKKSMAMLQVILGTIVFYMLLSFIITSIIPTTPLTKSLITGFLEITNGLNNLQVGNISLKLKEIIAIFIISFGGLSIHTQVKAILDDTPISYKAFLQGRILQAIISVSLLLLF